jgi:hypothetical protein
MLATRLPVRRTSAQTIRRLLLEIAYQVHTTKVVRRTPARDRRRQPRGFVLTY